ncbi:hypothetical protein BTR23_24950, partial [Alkalihalophilus pseudofirmus]
MKYGTYLKTVYQKDDRAAESCLKKAVRYETNLPIVYYRLGFLDYKRKRYASALRHFQAAIEYQQHKENAKYEMTDQQLYNCHLYLANCGLFIATNAQEDLNKLELNVNVVEVPNYELSPFFEFIKGNDEYLERHAYQMVTSSGSQFGSKEQCESKLASRNTIILDFIG